MPLIAIKVTKNGLTVDGHAGYAKAGNDIICAAVSVLAQGLIHSLDALTEDEISYNIRDGRIDINYRDLCVNLSKSPDIKPHFSASFSIVNSIFSPLCFSYSSLASCRNFLAT